jgi:hypothetical protein
MPRSTYEEHSAYYLNKIFVNEECAGRSAGHNAPNNNIVIYQENIFWQSPSETWVLESARSQRDPTNLTNVQIQLT